MQFTLPTLALLAATLTAALPQSPVGGSYVAVGTKYNKGGCLPSAVVNSPDPIFGRGNICQPLDRFGDGAPIVSYNLTNLSSSCSGVRLYLTSDCSGTSFNAPLNQCVQGNTPFISAFVTCAV